MTATPYVPREGSIAAQAIEVLTVRAVPMSDRDIRDKIEGECSGNSLQPFLVSAVRHGLVVMEHREGALWWRLGDGTPPAPAPSASDAAPPPVPRAPAPRKYSAPSAPAPSTPIVDALLDKPWRKKKNASKKSPKPVVVARAKPSRPAPPQAAVINRALAPRSTPPTPALAAASGLSCALFNTGDLFIEQPDGASIRLSRDQARELVAYLDRIANASTPETA